MFSILISSAVNINNYNPHKQNSFSPSVIFKYKGPKAKKFANYCSMKIYTF